MNKRLNRLILTLTLGIMMSGLASCKSDAPADHSFTGTYKGEVIHTVGQTAAGTVKADEAQVTIQKINGKYTITFSDNIPAVVEIAMEEEENRLEAIANKESSYIAGLVIRNKDGSINFSFASKDFRTWKGTNCERVTR